MISTNSIILSSTLSLALLLDSTAYGAISFTGAEPFTVASRPDWIVSADFNRDGDADVVVGSGSGGIAILLGSRASASRFGSATVLQFGQRLNATAVADLNQDQVPDLVVPDHGLGSTGVWILLGRGDGTFGSPSLTRVGSEPTAVAVADFDGARGNDLAVMDRRLHGVFIGLNDGQNLPGFNFLPRLPVRPGPREILAADVSGDGQADLVTLSRRDPSMNGLSVLVFANLVAGLPTFEPMRTFEAGDDPFSMVAAKFNEDATEDIALLNRRSGATDQVQVFLSNAGGFLAPPLELDLACPFFTGGRICPARTLTAGDFNRDNENDLAIALVDPRIIVNTDVLQVLAGRGDGGFIQGPAFPIGKDPADVTTADIIDNNHLDLVVASKRHLHVQAFINVSTSGKMGNGEPCFEGDECLSGRCTDGRCCATQCFDFERCDVPTQEGICTRIDPPVECIDDLDCEGDGRCLTNPSRTCFDDGDCKGTCLLKSCTDGFCCDQYCLPGMNRCNTPGFEGICIPKLETGRACFEDADCSTGFCRHGFCCDTDCPDGACSVPGSEGQCFSLLPNGNFCDDEDQICQSGVCDDFDLICCNRVCFDDELCTFDGECEAFELTTPTPIGTPAGTATATVPISPTSTPTATSMRTVTPTNSASPTLSATATSTPALCPGDCDGSGEVHVDEVIIGVALLLDRPAKTCAAADLNDDGDVTVDEVVTAVEAALHGCGSMQQIFNPSSP